MDADSPTYAKNKHCEFWLQGSGGGVLASPRHSLPRNSTCLYHLRGAGPAMPSPTPPRPLPKFPEQRPGTVWRRPAPRPQQPQFRVWLSILKFHVGTSLSSTDEDCSTTLMVWDGEMMPLSECNDLAWSVEPPLINCSVDGQPFATRRQTYSPHLVVDGYTSIALMAFICSEIFFCWAFF